MPKYEYLCDKGHEVVVEQSITSDALTVCTMGVCHCAEKENPTPCGAPTRRLISKTSFKFKGGPPTPKHYQ
jgi:predicted nucleic acid-binding Zn ribbon protein